MKQDEQHHVSLNENFHRRVGGWSVSDIILIVAFCEAFEEFGFDAVNRLSTYVMIPSTNGNGEIDRQVFEIEFSFGRKMLQLILIEKRIFLLSD